MGLTEHTQKLTSQAVLNNALADLLCGYPPYAIPDREGLYTTDRSGVLYCGICNYYHSDRSVKVLFEKALLHLMQGSAFELMSAFEYVRLCKASEWRGSAPFTLSSECAASLKQIVNSRRAELEQYKELPEFGSVLPSGAWDYIRNMEALLVRQYGRSLWD